jgi:hypothetical protein
MNEGKEFLSLQVKRPLDKDYALAIERYSKSGFNKTSPELDKYLSLEGWYISSRFNSEDFPKEIWLKRILDEEGFDGKNHPNCLELESRIVMPIDRSDLNFLNGKACVRVQINRDYKAGNRILRGKHEVILQYHPFVARGLRQRFGLILPGLLSQVERENRDYPYLFGTSWGVEPINFSK